MEERFEFSAHRGRIFHRILYNVIDERVNAIGVERGLSHIEFIQYYACPNTCTKYKLRSYNQNVRDQIGSSKLNNIQLNSPRDHRSEDASYGFSCTSSGDMYSGVPVFRTFTNQINRGIASENHK
jgi:hypothetical protein